MAWINVEKNHRPDWLRGMGLHEPVKLWERVEGERYKVKHKATKGTKSPETSQEYNERRAIEYARWLAKRDGIALPADGKARAMWSGVHVDGKWQKRIKSVDWVRSCRKYYAPRRRYIETDEHLLSVDIPNWDWVPEVTEDHEADNVVAFANSLTSEQACRLINIADPLTPEERLMFDAMSTDDLAASLRA